MSGQLLYPLSGMALAAAFAIAVVMAAWRGAHPVWLIAVIGAPILVLLAMPDWRLFNVHGLMHASIVFEIYERGLPPEMPLVAGAPLQYFYGIHFVVAAVMKLVPLSPAWAFTYLNVFCLAATIVVLDSIARVISSAYRYRWIAIFSMLFGTNILVSEQHRKNLS